jgi:7-cyano-7-deazaguanine reductase
VAPHHRQLRKRGFTELTRDFGDMCPGCNGSYFQRVGCRKSSNGAVILPPWWFMLFAPRPDHATSPMAKKPLQLGRPTPLPASPDQAVLDRVPNPHPGTNYMARFTFPEFTLMCPVTGQPDFATVVIDYVPKDWLVESKSLKLYLNSFRNHGAFHEECTVSIGKKLVALLKPKWLRIGGYFHPRGGMPIDVFWQAGKLPSGVWAPDQGVRTYSARS